MKFHHFKLASLIVSLMLVAPAAFARDSKSSARSSSDSIVSHSAQSESGSGGMHFGLGYSTNGVPTNAYMASPVVMLQLNERNLIQFHFYFPTTRAFTFIGGPLYKYSVVEKNGAGFHIGGGAMAGSIGSNFALQGQVVAGLHFAIPGTSGDVVMHFDGGPTFEVFGGGSTNFYLGANSPLLGATIAYMF